jgi:hypothetical protein
MRRCREQGAQAIASVLEKGIEPGKGAAFAMSLLDLLHAAETDEGLAAGFLRRQAGADAVLGMERHMSFEFGAEVVAGTARVEETEKTKAECS